MTGESSVDDRDSRAVHLRRVIARHFPADRRAEILDLGCGDGTVLHFLREAGYRSLRGVDTSGKRLNEARARGFDAMDQADIRDFVGGLAAASQDVVVTWDVLEHLPRTDLVRFAGLVHRALRPQGLWVAHVPNAESPFGARVLYADLTHETAFTRESIADLARSAGFTRVRCFEDEPVISGLHGLMRWIAWRGIRAGLRLWAAAETGEPGAESIFSRNLLMVAGRA